MDYFAARLVLISDQCQETGRALEAVFPVVRVAGAETGEIFYGGTAEAGFVAAVWIQPVKLEGEIVTQAVVSGDGAQGGD